MSAHLINVSVTKDCWDYLYIIVTSIITTFIAGGVWRVAYLQMKTLKNQAAHEAFIGSEKLKHDLFEKRYMVFTKIHEMLEKALQTGELSADELYKFRSDILPTDFLFDKEITTYIYNLYDEFALMVSNLRNQLGKSGIILGNEDCARIQSFNKHIKELHTVFASHLKFELWRNKGAIP